MFITFVQNLYQQMPRPKKFRKVLAPPQMRGYLPYDIENSSGEPVRLKFEEFECIRLLNYESLSQEEASQRMAVSRPTLTRMYNAALKKLANALVIGLPIIIEGGQYELTDDWYKCRYCHRLIAGKENHKPCKGCEFYGDDELVSLGCGVENK